MLITCRSEFNEMVNAVSHSKVIAVDSETNGVSLRHGDYVVGISVYTDFNDKTYYLPIAHGEGRISDKPYTEFKRWDNSKKRAYAEHVYNTHLRAQVQRANMPRAWVDELIAVWLKPETHVFHNATFDLTALGNLGFPMPPNLEDTMIMLSVINSDWSGDVATGTVPRYLMPDTGKYEAGNRRLKWQARLFGLADAKAGIDELSENVLKLNGRLNALGTEFLGKADLGMTKDHPAVAFIWMLEPREVSLYAEDDTRLTYLLWQRINEHLKKWDDVALAAKYNKFMSRVAYTMEHHGFKLDTARVDSMLAASKVELERLEGEIAIATHSIVHNPSSPAQVKAYLNAIGLDIESTAKAELAKISGVPALDSITFYRKMVTLGTVIEKWRTNAVHDFIHPELRVAAASTGRSTSGSEMFGNLQNVARVDEKDVIQPKRTLLSPAPNTLLFDVDYAALEIRIGAWVAETLIGEGRDLTLTKLVEADEDMHLYTMEVSGIYDIILKGLSPSDWLRKNGYNVDAIDDPKKYFIKYIARYKAKTTNFACMYGAGVRGIVKAVGCTVEEAEVLLKGFHRAYPAIPRAMEYLQKLALKPRKFSEFHDELSLYIKYPVKGLELKRKYSYYPSVAYNASGGSWNPQASAARGAFNSVVQGSGGLIMFNSILNFHEEFGVASYEWQGNERVYDYSSGLVVPCASVHDSVIFALRPQDAPKVIPRMREILTDYEVRPRLDVGVDYAEVGKSWGEVSEWGN